MEKGAIPTPLGLMSLERLKSNEMTDHNDNIMHVKRIRINGMVTQRLLIKREGEKIPRIIKTVKCMASFRYAIFESLPPFCSNCSQWGQGARACPCEQPRCRYCAAAHASNDCAGKISQGNQIPRKFVNCRLEHDANSSLCVYYPKDREK